MSDRNDLLESLFDKTIEALLDRVKSGEASASELNVARQMLKDNGIEAIATPSNPLGSLASQLPVFSDDEKDKYNIN